MILISFYKPKVNGHMKACSQNKSDSVNDDTSCSTESERKKFIKLSGLDMFTHRVINDDESRPVAEKSLANLALSAAQALTTVISDDNELRKSSVFLCLRKLLLINK